MFQRAASTTVSQRDKAFSVSGQTRALTGPEQLSHLPYALSRTDCHLLALVPHPVYAQISVPWWLPPSGEQAGTVFYGPRILLSKIFSLRVYPSP